MAGGDVAVVRRRLLVEGRVQGVFYRDSCRRQAEALGVAGSARNLHDGRVEVVVEGEEAAVDALEAWCRRGPPRAVVTGVRRIDEPPEGLSSFRIR